MENASKALMIAGGVMIALLVTTLLVLGLSRLRHYQNTQIAAKKNEQAAEFNNRFESYNKGVVTGYELVSLGHLTVDSNIRYPEDQGYTPVDVYINIKKTTSDGVLGGYMDSNHEKIKKGLKDYYDLVEYVDGFYDTLSDATPSEYNAKKKFKEAYFKCDEVEYDSGSARVTKMYFSQLTKKE